MSEVEELEPTPTGGRFAYASYGDIQNYLSFIPTFTATSKPNASQAHGALVDASNELDSVLAISDYPTPLPTTAVHALELARSWVSIGGAAKVAKAMPQGEESKHAKALSKEWTSLLNEVRGGKIALPIDSGRERDRTRARHGTPAVPGGPCGVGGPTFTRGHIER